MFNQIKIIGMIAGVFALVGVLSYFRHVFDERSELRDFKHQVVEMTRVAADRPKLAEDQVPLQIKYLGESLDSLRTKVGVQNSAIASLADQRKNALATADHEAALRKEVIQQSKDLSQILRNEAMTPVERTHLETELRRVQDLAWELGI